MERSWFDAESWAPAEGIRDLERLFWRLKAGEEPGVGGLTDSMDHTKRIVLSNVKDGQFVFRETRDFVNKMEWNMKDKRKAERRII